MPACYVHLTGGLGDQLFQVAAGYAHCKRHGYDLRLRTHPEWPPFFHKLTGSRGGQNLGLTWKEPGAAYTAVPFNALNLFGQFQTSKYFAEYAEELRSLFEPPLPRTVINPESICVYLDETCSPAYYERAIHHMQFLQPKADLLLISKDGEPLHFENCTVIRESDESEVLYLMRQCRYLVLSKSSLTWWGAWLATKPLYVIAPTGLAEDFYEARWDRMSQ